MVRAASCLPAAAMRVGAHRPAPVRTADALQGITVANSAEPFLLFKVCPSSLLTSSLIDKNLVGLGFPSKILPIKLKQEAPSGRPGFCAIFLASPEQPGMGKSEHLLNLISCFDFAPRAPLGLKVEHVSAIQKLRRFRPSFVCLLAISLLLAACPL